jgi:hypothetical protein
MKCGGGAANRWSKEHRVLVALDEGEAGLSHVKILGPDPSMYHRLAET